MDKYNVDGLIINDLLAKATQKNKNFQLTSINPPSTSNPESMAPRSESNSSQKLENFCDHHRFIRRFPLDIPKNFPHISELAKCEDGPNNPAKSPPFDLTGNSSMQSKSNASNDYLLNAVGNRIKLLSARCRLAERRAFRILSVLGRGLESHNNSPKMSFLDEDPSEVTESSSNDEEQGDLETWFQDRATIHSHWSILRSEMIRAIDCLHNLKPLYNRCKQWRKSMPLMAQSCSADVVNSRLLSHERNNERRHTYYDLSSLYSLDYTFPGSSLPSRVDHPKCLENCHNGCIMCCPAFISSRESCNPLRNRTDVPSRSLLLENYRINKSFGSTTRQLLCDGSSSCTNFKISRLASAISPSSSLSITSQEPYALERSDNVCKAPIRPNIRRKIISDKFPIHFKDPRSSVHRSDTSSFQGSTSREICTPQWRTLPPISNADSLLHSNWTISDQSSPCTTNSSHAYKTVAWDFDVEEDTSDKYYQDLHATEEKNEFLRKINSLHHNSLPASTNNH